MNRFLFAAALAVTVPAFAQDTTQTTPPAAPDNGMMKPTPDATMSPPPADSTMPATQPDATTTGTDTMTTQGAAGAAGTPDSSGTMSSGTMSSGTMSSGTMATPTPGTPDAGMAAPGAMAGAPAATAGPYPTCSKTVTDRCMNRSAMAKKPMRKRG